MQPTFKKCLALTLTLALAASFYGSTTDAAKKIKLSKTSKTLTKNTSFTLKVKGVKKVKWSVNNSRVVKLSAKKKNSVKIKGLKEGKAIVTARYNVKKKTKKLKCKITVTAKKPVVTQTPTITPAPYVPTPAPTAVPTATPVPTPIPSPSVMSDNGKWAYIPFGDDTLLKELEPIFGNVGTCLTYKGVFGKNEMQDAETMDFVKKHYNSYTLENEMKPSYMLADADADFRNPPFNKLLSVNDALAAGYTVPETYTEYYVPTINFERIGQILKTSADHGIRMRGHTLIWHSQTPTAFFKIDYDDSKGFVTPEVMDQRIIYYVTNVMKYVLNHEDGSVIYTWDVVNEYFHQLSDGTARNWSDIYNIEDNKGLISRPTYVKLAFKTAYDVLKSYGLNDKITLFYNDYNTSQVDDEIVDLVKYINETDELNPNGERLCNGVGMQCHLDVNWPPVKEQLNTVKKFLDAGFEVQITELDIINSKDADSNGKLDAKGEENLADYWFEFVKGLVDLRKSGGNITGITFWGLSDAVTWRYGKSALLFGESIKDPKKSLYAVYAAAQTWLGLDELY